MIHLEIQLFNKIEQKRSIIQMRLREAKGDSLSHLEDIFELVSERKGNYAQNFVSLENLNNFLRRPCDYSNLDHEEFVLLNIGFNNFYDSDGEISKDEFILFCISSRRQSSTQMEIIRRRVSKINPREEEEEMENLMRECRLEIQPNFNNFLELDNNEIPPNQSPGQETHDISGNEITKIAMGGRIGDKRNQLDLDHYYIDSQDEEEDPYKNFFQINNRVVKPQNEDDRITSPKFGSN